MAGPGAAASLACLVAAEGLAEVVWGFQPAGLWAVLLFPIRAAWQVAYVAAGVAPTLCALAFGVWRGLALPNSSGAAGQRIDAGLSRAFWGSLGLLTAVAAAGGTQARRAWLFGALAAVAMLVHKVVSSHGVRRTVRIWRFFLPCMLHYKLIIWWVARADLSEAEAIRLWLRAHEKWADKLVELFTDLGGIFVKMGQFLSLISNIGIPAAYMRRLKSLQSRVKHMPAEEARRLVVENLGQPIESVFSSFEDMPCGSASLGQVHRARLTKDGRDVAVKVQYPDVGKTLRMDMAWLTYAVKKLGGDDGALAMMREIEQAIIKELDFEAEAAALRRVGATIPKAFPGVHVPEPIPELCKPTLLVMTFISGMSILDSLMEMTKLTARVTGISVDELFAATGRKARDLKSTEMVDNAYAQAKDEKRPQAPAADAAQNGGAAQSGGAAQNGNAAQPQQPHAPAENGHAPPPPQPAKGPAISHAALLGAAMKSLSLFRSAQNTSIFMYNNTAGRLGAKPVDYFQVIPRFDPVFVSRTAWNVQGHQLLIDGFFNTDSHPGNFLIDPWSGNLGLIDFGQMCEIKLETRVRFARLVLALGTYDRTQVAKQWAQLGFRTKCMWAEHLELHARVKFGRLTSKEHEQFSKRTGELDKADPPLAQNNDEKLALVEKMIYLLRGTNIFLGVLGKHNAQTCWKQVAHQLLDAHGADYPDVDIPLDVAPMPSELVRADSDTGTAEPPGPEARDVAAAGAEGAAGGSGAPLGLDGFALGLAMAGAQWFDLSPFDLYN